MQSWDNKFVRPVILIKQKITKFMNNSEIKTVTSSKDRAVFKLGPVCAKMVTLHLHEKKPGFNDSSPWLDLEKTTISNVTKISPNTKGGTEVVVENLKPCTLYSVDIELSFGDKRSPTDEEDFIKDRIFDFYTMPDNKDDSQSRQKHLMSRRESNVVENVVKSGDTAKMPIECLSDNDPIVLSLIAEEDEKLFLHIYGYNHRSLFNRDPDSDHPRLFLDILSPTPRPTGDEGEDSSAFSFL